MKLPRLPPAGNILEAKYTAQQMRDYANKSVAAALEAITDEWWTRVHADLEHGAARLNEEATQEFAKSYPRVSKFGAYLDEKDIS